MRTTPLLRKVDAVTVPVPDLDSGLRFYCDALGHLPLWRNQALGQAGLSLPDSDTVIVLTTGLGYAPNWLVDSADEAADAIRAAGGGIITEPFDLPVGRVAVVSDAFGNVLVLVDLSHGSYSTNDSSKVPDCDRAPRTRPRVLTETRSPWVGSALVQFMPGSGAARFWGRGMVTVTVRPPPGRGSAVTVPRCTAVIEATIARPRPKRSGGAVLQALEGFEEDSEGVPGDDGTGVGEVRVSRPSDALAAKQATDTTLTGLLLGLGAVALLVGGVGVANTMLISVLERRPEIGLRRSLGATRRHIRIQFLAESLLLSTLGGLCGALFGIAVTGAYAAYQDWPAVVPLWATVGGVLATLVIGASAGVYPAWRAARLSPTDALTAP